jgi:hypothetical protein
MEAQAPDMLIQKTICVAFVAVVQFQYSAVSGFRGSDFHRAPILE